MYCSKWIRLGLIGLFISLFTLNCGSPEAKENANAQQNNEAKPDTAAQADSTTKKPQRPPIPRIPGREVLVETAVLSPRTLKSFLLLTSTLQTESMIDVYARITGNIEKLMVEEGDRVKKGSLLIQLDDR